MKFYHIVYFQLVRTEKKATMEKSTPNIRRKLAEAHGSSKYYDEVETGPSLEIFWGQRGHFRPLFDRMNLSNVMELACGHGRHASQFIDVAGAVTLVDAAPENIAFVKGRFADRRNVSYLLTAGNSLLGLADASYSAAFSYDSMVHFEAADVISYVFEISRILRKDGMALLHYSNNDRDPEGTYADDPAWRSFFTERMMRHFSSRAGFAIVDSRIIDWPPGPGGRPYYDAVTLLQKVGT